MCDNGLLFNSLCESAPFGLFVSDTDGSCVYANAEYLRITGLSATEIPGPGWSMTIHPEDRSRILDMLYQATETHEPFSCQYRIVKRDGTLANILIKAAPLMIDRKVTGIVAIIEDITLRLKMESQLRINFAAMESSTTMIMITDEKGLITWINPAFSKGTGYTFDEVAGNSPRMFSTLLESPARDALQKSIATGQSWQGEILNRRKDGSFYLEEEIITPIIGTDGKISHFLALKRDITEQRENERKLANYSEHLEELVQERTRELEEAQKRILQQLQLEQDLKIAAQIQLSLLPDKPPVIRGFEIASRAFAAHYISGDLYDFALKDDQNLYILMADISGKGIPAALLAASARTTVREKLLVTDSPAGVLDLVNRTLYADLNTTEMFITMMLARINIETGTCTYSNAGHTRTMHYHAKDRSLNLLGATCLPVGVFPDLTAREQQVQLDAGDTLFFYSDGLTEAASLSGDLLGEEALAEAFNHTAENGSTQIDDSIFALVGTFSGNTLPDDDRSVIIIKRQNASRYQSFILDSASFDEIISLSKTKAIVFGDAFASDIELAMTELLTNIIHHAYGIDLDELDTQAQRITHEGATAPSVEISFTATENHLCIDLFDRGKAFEPETLAACDAHAEGDPQNLREGGYGYHLIQQLTDIVTYTRESDNRNHWHLEKIRKEAK